MEDLLSSMLLTTAPPTGRATSPSPSEVPPTTAPATEISPNEVQSSCPFLKKLPTELRNNIYELTFLSDSEATVDLFAAKPPQKALPGTCKQIHREAKAMYKDAYRSYWRDTEFSITMENERLPNVPRLSCADLDNLRHLDITCTSENHVGNFVNHVRILDGDIIRVEEVFRRGYTTRWTSYLYARFFPNDGGYGLSRAHYLCSRYRHCGGGGDVLLMARDDEETTRALATAERVRVPLHLVLDAFCDRAFRRYIRWAELEARAEESRARQ